MGQGIGENAAQVLPCRTRRRQYRAIIYVLTILLILSLMSLVVIGSRVNWVDRVINDDLLPFYLPVLEADAEGRLHVVYTCEWGGLPRHAVLVEGEWHEESIELDEDDMRQVENLSGGWESRCPLVSFDSSSNIRLGYLFPDGDRTLGVIQETEDGFEFHTVDSDVCRRNGMAIDSNGWTHFIYSVHEVDTVNITIVHAVVDGDDVTRNVIAEVQYSEYEYLDTDYSDILGRYNCHIIIDSAGEPVAVVYDSAKGQIWCYSNLTGVVTSEMIAGDAANYGYDESLIAGEEGRLDFFWISAETDGECLLLRHASREDGRWACESRQTDISVQSSSVDVAATGDEGVFRAVVRTYEPDRILSLVQSGDTWLSEIVRAEPQSLSNTSYDISRLQRWLGGPIRAVSDGNGNFFVSKPYGHPGIITDDVTMTDWLQEASSTMLIFILIAAPVALLLIPIGKAEEWECLWQKIVRGRR